MRIVGVGDEKDKALSNPAVPMLYFPYTQIMPRWTMSLVLRTKGDPASLATALRQQIHDMDSALPVENLQSMDSAISDTEGDARFLGSGPGSSYSE